MEQRFQNTCRKITEHKYFTPHIANEELLSLVRDKSGKSIHQPPKQAIAITPSPYETSVGVLYEVKKTENNPEWHVDDSLHILVRYNGEITFLDRVDIKNNNLEFGRTWLLLRHILEQEFLHLNYVKPQTYALR